MTESGLPDEIIEKLADRLEGTCHSEANELELLLESEGLSHLDFDESAVESDLLTLEVELCQGCGWWMHSGELVCVHDSYGFCDQCRIHDGYCEECEREYLGE